MDETTRILIERIEQWFNGRPAGPYKLQLNPTNRCNLNCLSCSARGKVTYEPSKEVPGEMYIKLIREAKELGVLYCDICGGGEPFARAETSLSIMREIKKEGIIGTVITNGTLLSGEAVKELVEIEWDFVNLSIDGPNAEINDYLRGEGTFQKNMQAIRLINFWKKKLEKNTTHLCIFTVLSKKNYIHIPKLFDLAAGLQIDGIFLQPVIVAGGDGQGLVMDEKDICTFKKILSTLRKRLSGSRINSNVEFIDQHLLKDVAEIKTRKELEPNETGAICYSPWLVAAVGADGTVGPCPPGIQFMDGTNIKNHTLGEIWNGKIFNDFRREITKKKKPLWCMNCGSMEIIANREIMKRIRCGVEQLQST